MTVHSSGDQIDAVIAMLRAEEPLEQDGSQQAILRHETGVLELARGEGKAGAREFLAAYNCAPDFREPLEALIAIYGRKRSEKNYAKLLETLVDVADTPAATARALWELAAFHQDIGSDAAEARACLERALESEPNDAACWLELEMLAARDGDAGAKMRALEARSKLTNDPTWQGLLLLELARACADEGDLDRATTLLDTVAGLEGRARFLSRVLLETIARAAGDAELEAHALEGQAELISQGIDDPDTAHAVGVPSLTCSAEFAADAWLRAGVLRRRADDAYGAMAALQGAAEKLPDSGLVARLRVAAADAAGDAAAAVAIAKEQLERGATGPAAAGLWVRVGMAAERGDDPHGAAEAYGKALESDPKTVVAATLQMDLLSRGGDPEAFAMALEKAQLVAGEQPEGEDTEAARAWMAIAYVWAIRAGEVVRAQAALERAIQHGMAREAAARVARSFASICDAEAWYEEATEQLLAASEPGPDLVGLYFELGRHRLARGDKAGTRDAFALIAAQGSDEPGNGPAWLGRALAAYGVLGEERHTAQDVAAFAKVEPNVTMGRGLSVVAAVLARRADDPDTAIALLQTEHRREPGDLVVAVLLADLFRAKAQSGDKGPLRLAAETLAACAVAIEDPAQSGALHIEAGMLLWRTGARDEGVAAFESALEYTPQPARLALTWALRAVDPNNLDARRRAVELAEESETDRATGALERFGLGIAMREGDTDAWAALEQLEDLNPGGDLSDTAALARLLWIDDDGDHQTTMTALDRVEGLGDDAVGVARAERFRHMRFVEKDEPRTLTAARAWAESEGSLAATLEWLAAATRSSDRSAEVAARRMVASHLDGGDRALANATASAIELIEQPDRAQALLEGGHASSHLMNLELAPPGGDPRRRALALRALGKTLGEDAQRDALRLAAWSDLAAGEAEAAQVAFKKLTTADAEDFASWEGLRAAALSVGDHLSVGLALAQLGNLMKDDAQSAALWEQAGLVLLESTDAHDDAEIAFQRALDREPKRDVAFDKLFRRVRARNEDERLLTLIDKRLEVSEDEAEITKMYWERARVLRRMDKQEAALKCLRHVTLLEPDHVGALALAGEIRITRKEFAEAAPLLARLAALDQAPQQQRLVSGVAAVDLYEKKLGDPNKALEVLAALHKAGLSTLPVRERMARLAARTEDWGNAVAILEKLMEERDSSAGRVDAARLALAIYRDKLNTPAKAEKAAVRMLKETPDDAEALELILDFPVSSQLRASAVPTARKIVRGKLISDPFDSERLALMAKIALAEEDWPLRHAALGCLIATGHANEAIERECAELDARAANLPQMVLDEHAVGGIADPDDTGPLAALFALVAPVISDALGPSLKSEGVGRKQRVGAGDALRVEVSRWMASLGFDDFELYVGGRDEHAVRGVAGDTPAVVVGSGVTAPLDAPTRSAVAREVFALRRGTTAVLHCDDHTIASIVVALCNDAGVATPEPPYAVYREVVRAVKLSRKLRKQLRGPCNAVLQTQQDALLWAAAARRSIDRMALIAAGVPSVVLDDVVGRLGTPGRKAMAANARASGLLSFGLSPEYLELRQRFGMGIA